MSLFNKEVLKINDKLFIVKRVIEEQFCKDVELLKIWTDSDIVFRREHLMYFCESIVDLEYETV